MRVANGSGRPAIGLQLKFKGESETGTQAGARFEARVLHKQNIRVAVEHESNSVALVSNQGPINPGQAMVFVLSSNNVLAFESGHWTLTEEATSAYVGGKVIEEDVHFERRYLTSDPPKKSKEVLSTYAWVPGAALIAVIFLTWTINSARKPGSIEIEVPPAASDLLASRVHDAIKQFPSTDGGLQPSIFSLSKSDAGAIKLSSAVTEKLKKDPAKYNKPDVLLLGEPTTVQLVIQTDKNQDTDSNFNGFEGAVTLTTVLIAKDVSANLTGTEGRLKITPRIESNKQTVLSPSPLLWTWDVQPLKPGPALVTIEVFSYIKVGKDTERVRIRVAQDTWMVEARGLEWVNYQIRQIEPIQAFGVGIGGVVAALLAWFGFKGWGGKKSDFES